MSDKARWASIYLLGAAFPLFFYFIAPLSHEIISDRVFNNFLIFAPYVGLVLIGVLGWQVNQTRIFWSALFLLVFYVYLLNPGTFVISETGRVATLQIISVAFPLALCLVFFLKESRLWSDLSLARFLLALIPFILLACLYGWAPDIYQKTMYWGPVTLPPPLYLPKSSWAAIGLFLLVAYSLFDPKIKSFLIALCVALVPLVFTLQANLAGLGTTKVPTRVHIILDFTVLTLILLHALLRMYWQKVYLDPLTAVSNRQAMDERLHTLGGDFCLAMVDIDHFKKFNDNYGHAEGDNVLRMVAQHLQEHLGDNVYRYGGEEFCAVFEKGPPEKAKETMERVRATLEKRKFVLRGQRKTGYNGISMPFQKEKGGRKAKITVSIGVASTTKTHKTAEEVIKRADHALYEAKEKGRNRVVSA